MGKSVIRTSALVLAFLLLPSIAVAAGLGKLTVLSGLGQPLKAEIELLAMQKGEADNLSVRLASPDAFRNANVDFSGALLSVKFAIEQRGVGHYIVVLSSTQPINEPFMDMLVELDWSTGRLVREYTFLLDPPEYKAPQPAPAIVAPSTGVPAIKSVEKPRQPAPAVIAPSAERPMTAATRRAPTSAASNASKNYEVKQGDTLTKIANANRPGNVSLQQMLLALYRSNADAFDGNNMNRMRAGRILNIPEPDAAAAVNQDEAVRTVVAQAAEFNDYRRKLAGAAAAAPERAGGRRQSATGKITARVEEKPAAAKETRDQLKLSKTQEPGKSGAARSPQGLQEDLASKEKALKEANERVAMLEKNVQDMQKLLALKSQSGAQMQQQAAKATEPPKAAEPAKPIAPAKVVEPAKTPAPANAAGPAKPEAAATAPPASVAPKPAPPKAPAKKLVPPPPPPEPSLIEEILSNELAVYGGGAFLLLLFIAYGYYAWRRKKTLQQMDSSSIMAAPEFPPDSVFGAAGGATVDTDQGVDQAEFAAGATAAAGTEEVDPIAEADVYMAYGRDAQAEDILKDALNKNPSRQAIRAKLLEIYANRKDATAFEAVAAEIHAGTNGEGPEWAKAVALGAQLDPGNPLYGGGAAPGATHVDVSDTQPVSGGRAMPETGGAESVSPGLDFDLGQSEPAADATAQPEDATASDSPGDLGFDLDIGGGENQAEAIPQPEHAAAMAPGSAGKADETPSDAVTSIDFDFELPGAGEATPVPASATGAAPAAAAEHPAAADGGGGIDFDFNLDVPEQQEEAPAAPLDLSAISLDLGAPGEAAPTADAHWQEVATKLDLSKAYQEMGDKDGARELLGEVLKEGDATQQEQAKAMLAALG